MSTDSAQSSASSSSRNSEDERRAATLHPQGQLQARGISKLNPLHRFGQILVVITVALFGLSIAAIALSQAQMINTLSPLYVFGGFIVSLVFLGIYHGCKKRVAEKYGVNFEHYEDAKIGFKKKKAKPEETE